MTGVIITAAAGNDDDGVDYPGKYGSVICTGAHTRNEEPSPISSTGPELDFLCPGEGIQGRSRDHTTAHGLQETGAHIEGAVQVADGSSVAVAHMGGLIGELRSHVSPTSYRLHAPLTALILGNKNAGKLAPGDRESRAIQGVDDVRSFAIATLCSDQWGHADG